ncbi:MAG TPA: DUF5343 domain-containing protein [Candidatus Limnocylindria bacterium]
MATPNTTSKTAAPPYVPFKSLTNFIEKTPPQTLPPQVDRDYFHSMAGGQRWPFMAALKWFGLIKEDGTVEPSLIDLVDNPTTRKDHLSQIIRSRYQWLDALNQKKATMGALKAAFAEHTKGSTQKKAIRFYLQAAQYAGITISPNFKLTGGDPATPSAPRTRTKRKGTKHDDTPPPPPPAGPTPPPATTWLDQLPKEVQGALAQLPSGGDLTTDEIDDLVTVYKVALKRAFGSREKPKK